MRGAMSAGHSFLLDPWALARSGSSGSSGSSGRRSWAGIVPLRAFDRLAPLAGSGATAVEVRLDFGLDDEGRCRVRGSARLRAGVPCQRCARTVPRAVEADIDLLVLTSEAEARALTPGHDTCVVTDPSVPVAALIEDDLLLSFPEHGCEARDACEHAAFAARAGPPPGPDGEPSGTRRESPFAVLAELAARRDQGGG